MNYSRSDKLHDVHSDIRGPIYIEALKMGAAGIDVLRLNTGNPGSFGFGMPASIRAALDGNLDKAVAYCDLKGMPEAREAIADYCRNKKHIRGVSADNIYIGNGVSELVPILLMALLNYGDEVLIPAPDYSLWTNSVRMAGAVPVHYVCDEQAHWYPDLDDIRKKITPKTRALLLINPNNPTGVLYPEEIVQGMVDIAREHHLVIFADEIYDRLIMDGKSHTSAAALAPDLLCITTNGLSKSHIICGFRCGWMAISGPTELAADFLDGIDALCSMRLCANALAQLVIPAALKDEESTKAMLVPGGRLYEQREISCTELSKIPGVSFVKNDAAFYMFVKLDVKRFNITSDQQFALDFLHSKNVLIIPGNGFSWQAPDHFRIVMLPEKERLGKAIQALGDFLSTYKQV